MAQSVFAAGHTLVKRFTDPMPFFLRPYEHADFESLYLLDQACYPRGIAYSRRTLRWFLSQQGADCLVAEPEEADTLEVTGAQPSAAGFIIAQIEGGAAHIITLDVGIAYRRRGLGTLLLQGMESRLADQGSYQISLETKTSDEAAVAFWQKHGYRAVGILQRYYLNRFDALAMIKDLRER